MIQKTTLSGAVIEEVRSRIAIGKWKPGDKLPPLRALTAEFGVSLSPLREALKALEAANVLTIRPGDGIYVSSNLPPPITEQISSLLLWDGTHIIDILDIRTLLETETARRAALNATSPQMQRLTELLERMKASREDHPQFVDADFEVHLVIAEASGSGLFRRILETLSDLLKEQLKRAPLVEEAIRSHERILRAVLARDADEARAAMEDHLNEIRSYLLGG